MNGVVFVTLGICLTCMTLSCFRKDLTNLHIKTNFMEIREQHRAEEVIQYRHEIFRLMQEVRDAYIKSSSARDVI